MPETLNPQQHDTESVHELKKVSVILGGMFLSVMAGWINVVYMLELKIPVSHLTGIYTSILIDTKYTQLHHLKEIISVFLGFFTGAVFSGILIAPSRLKLGQKYGIALMCQGISLSAGCVVFYNFENISLFLGGFTCGSMNAMAIFYRGVVLRTTHITGLMTDLGRSIGTLLRGGMIQKWKIGLNLLLIVSFFVGTCCGVLMDQFVNINSNFIPGFLLVSVGLTYFYYRTHKQL